MAEGNICLSSELQEWKSTPVGHAGLWVIQPYKGIAEAEDSHTNPAHAHTSTWVCASVVGRRRGEEVVVPAGQLKYSAERSTATARDSRNS